MPTHIQTYYPLPSGNPFKMILEHDNNVLQLRFQRRGNPWTNMQCQILSPRAQVALIGSMARTVPVATNRFIWEPQATPILHAHRIILTTGGRGFFIHEINRNGVDISNINVNAVESIYCSPNQIQNNPRVIVTNWRNTMSMAEFVREIYLVRAALSTRFMSRLAIVVAVGTGVAISLGFGPAAGMAGIGSSLSGIGNAVATGMAHGITTLMQGSFEEMIRIVHSRDQADFQRNAQRNATRFWENNRETIHRIIGRSLSNAVFNAATSFIPGRNINSSSDMTMGTLARMILNRLGNNLTSTFQSIVEAWARGQDPDWDAIETNTIRNFTIRAIS